MKELVEVKGGVVKELVALKVRETMKDSLSLVKVKDSLSSSEESS